MTVKLLSNESSEFKLDPHVIAALLTSTVVVESRPDERSKSKQELLLWRSLPR